MKKLLFIMAASILASSCTTPVDQTANPVKDYSIEIETDIQSCLRDPLQPWCESQCQLNVREWCNVQ